MSLALLIYSQNIRWFVLLSFALKCSFDLGSLEKPVLYLNIKKDMMGGKLGRVRFIEISWSVTTDRANNCQFELYSD